MADNELIDAKPQSFRAPSEQVAGVNNLLALAIDKGITPEAMEKLVMLQERVMAKQAEAEFTEALLNFQFACPLIGKSREVNAGPYKYKYAELSHIVDVIRPTLRDFGLSFAFDSEGDAGAIIVICILRHVAGHCTRTRFPAKIDPSSKMNDTQKVASAITYARRYALVLALGLTIGEDDDGRQGPEQYENAPRRQDAPRAQPRAQRQKPVTKEEVMQLYKEWCIANPGEQLPTAFPDFIFAKTGREFNPKVTAEWTRDDLNKCFRALGIGEE